MGPENKIPHFSRNTTQDSKVHLSKTDKTRFKSQKSPKQEISDFAGKKYSSNGNEPNDLNYKNGHLPKRFGVLSLNKKERHKSIVNSYHTKVCSDEKSNKCPYDFFKCFDSHEPNYIRRVPFKTINGWNYNFEMCYFSEKGLKCSSGSSCVYSHSNDVNKKLKFKI
ncbi:hypothetical protein MHBO_001265, partial [Bonamia ostreae]